MTKKMGRGRRLLLISGIFLTAILLVTAGALSARRQQPKKDQEQPRVTSMPPVFSKVKNLEIVRAWIIDPGTAAAGVAVEIKNNSNRDVMAVDLVCGEGAITRNGLTDEEHPVVVIRPNDTTTITMSFSEMTFGAPLVVSAVTYADRTEEGDERSLRAMHLSREHDRAVIKAKKERDAQKAAIKP